MHSEDQNQIINLNDIDIFDDEVENLTPEQEDFLLKRVRSETYVIPTVPCECNFCHNWIDNTDLFHIIGWHNDKIICLECAEPIFKREDMRMMVMTKKITRKVKAKVGAFFYDTETKKDVEYSKEYELNCEHHVAFKLFLEKLHNEGILQHMTKMFGNISNYTDISNKFYLIEELYVHVPITEERFEEMCLKWEAIFKQNGVI